MYVLWVNDHCKYVVDLLFHVRDDIYRIDIYRLVQWPINHQAAIFIWYSRWCVRLVNTNIQVVIYLQLACYCRIIVFQLTSWSTGLYPTHEHCMLLIAK